MRCPKCGGRVEDARTAFLEIGEYDGDRYEHEFDAEGYFCDSCNITFWVAAGIIRPPAT